MSKPTGPAFLGIFLHGLNRCIGDLPRRFESMGVLIFFDGLGLSPWGVLSCLEVNRSSCDGKFLNGGRCVVELFGRVSLALPEVLMERGVPSKEHVTSPMESVKLGRR